MCLFRCIFLVLGVLRPMIVLFRVNTFSLCSTQTPHSESDACSHDVLVSSYSSRVALDDELSVPAGHVVLVPCVYVDACSETLDCVADPLELFVDKFPTLSVTPALVTVGPEFLQL